MKRFLIVVFLTLFICKISANTIINGVIKLPKHFKVENTFSGDLSDNKSFHLVFSKNKKNKQYTVHSYIFDGENIEEITPLENEKPFEVVSFHQLNNELTLLLSFEKKKESFLKKVIVNIETKEVSENLPIEHKDYSASFREGNRSVLLYETDEKLLIKEYKGSKDVSFSEFVYTGKKDEIKKYFNDNSLIPIKTNEFVTNGATSTLRGYLKDKTITITKENEDDNITEVLALNFKNSSIAFSKIKSFNNSNGDKGFKKSTSYINNNKLFQLGLSKKLGKIKITDIQSEKKLNTINLDASLVSKIKGNKEFQGIENFLKNAGKNKYNSTITVNKTNTNKVRVRVDYVDISYNYHYNWWWHHQQFMMWHQQQMMQNIQINVPRGFGPRQTNEVPFETATIKKEKRFFELLIDTNGLISDEDLPETTFKEIDKKKYIDRVEESKTFKNISTCFLEDSFRFIGYSKKLKGFIIQTNKIKE